MDRREWLIGEDLGRMLSFLRGRVDPLVARRFACACVRRVWSKVIAQSHVSVELQRQCQRAVELTEASLVGTVPQVELRKVDFGAITDGGDAAFMAAAHVGWNLFAALNELPLIDEFENAREVAFLAACAGGASESGEQLVLLRQLVTYPGE